jgi:hypothetical protein
MSAVRRVAVSVGEARRRREGVVLGEEDGDDDVEEEDEDKDEELSGSRFEMPLIAESRPWEKSH